MRRKITQACALKIIVRIGWYTRIGAISIGCIQGYEVFIGGAINIPHFNLDGIGLANGFITFTRIDFNCSQYWCHSA